MDFWATVKKGFLIQCILLSAALPAVASHLIGGDITYKCLGNNTFEIRLTLFQDCLNGFPEAIQADSISSIAIYTSGPNPVLVRALSTAFSSKDIVDPNFSNDCINNPPNTCMQREVFVFTETLPPSSTGYDIVYQRCCRNGAINNIYNSGNVGVTYTAHIPPFTAGDCPNNSAVYETVPPQIICVNNPFVYDFSATDSDNDSITYELCVAHSGGTLAIPQPTGSQITPPPYPSVNYFPPYSATYPLSGAPPLQIDPHTGIMTGTPNLVGRFVVTVCAHEWRNGSIINTVSRDVQFVVTNCSKAVVADIPELDGYPNTFAIECDDYTVHFVNNSVGANTDGEASPYFWDFGVPGATSTAFEPTYTYPDTGTYTVKLVVNRNSTCPDSITRLVKVYPKFIAGFTWSGNLCPGEPIQFTDTTFATYPPVVSWNWDFGDSTTSTQQNPVHIFEPPGGTKVVTLTTQSAIGCKDAASMTLEVSYFDLFAGNDTTIVQGYPFQLHASGSQYYQWIPPDYLSDDEIPDPVAEFPATGHYTYVLEGATEQGCSGTDTIHIQVVDRGIIFVPSAFSPNGDGLNDVLKPEIIGISLINKFEIFNRWGQLVFSATRTNNPQWNGMINGAPAESGTYFWIVEVTDPFGKRVIQKGDVTLLR